MKFGHSGYNVVLLGVLTRPDSLTSLGVLKIEGLIYAVELAPSVIC